MEEKKTTKHKKASKADLFKNIKCVTGEIALTYEDYLQTKHWKDLREKIAERDKYTCQRCNGIFKTNFVIHHNTYNYLGDERLKDLTFYCSRCHSVIHNDRKNKHVFNRSYHMLITQKMAKMNKEQIEKVLAFMDTV